ncbi:histidine kinase dimerization/phosphoacceptor domain -containing protein [Brumimicrobium mesophilum]|uniref:histidine kinase dimerization/phosphoacceptor domain -containing protein n=1 Tax=Brumimicrobium mesophilum TaxID=392717 RepID=UPI000D1441CC|nr:histidine kinase dimerization/phosphoacceptor domain -containing protein [Brumimicrobium mesophilum]
MTDILLNKIIDKTSVDEFKLSDFLDLINKFSLNIVSAKTVEEVFNILVCDVSNEFNFLDCEIYKIDTQNNSFSKLASFDLEKKSDSSLVSYDQFHMRIVAEKGESLLVEDISLNNNFFPKNVLEFRSELVVPIKLDNEVCAVLTSKHPHKNFYKEYHQKIIEVVISIAIGNLVKINKASELEDVREELVTILGRKSTDLDSAVDTLSNQFFTLKSQHQKQETLIQEVHHRVTNNLQIISSILHLYINKEKTINKNSLQEIHDRVHVMAFIHQNIYKSMEMNLVNPISYLNDLINYLKSTSNSLNTSFQPKLEIEHFGIDVLVPLGLLITEIIFYWTGQLKDDKLVNLDFKLMKGSVKGAYSFVIQDDELTKFESEMDFIESDDVNSILISALTEQLNGDLFQGFDNGNFLRINFKEFS